MRLGLDRLLTENPNLAGFTRHELGEIFSDWYERGDKLGLANALQQHPDWQAIAWKQLARALADFRDYHGAVDVVQKFGPRPQVVQPAKNESAAALRARFRANSADITAGTALYFADLSEQQLDDALRTLDMIIPLAAAPKHLVWLRAQIYLGKAEWTKAWADLQRFYAL
jgi:hypothetical protein